MADGVTTNLGLIKPEVGASNDTWGGKQNGNEDKIDAVFGDDGAGTSVGLHVGSGKTFWASAGAFMRSIASAFYLHDDDDDTKVVQFDVSGVTTGTTRTLSAPDKSITLAGIDDVAAMLNTGDIKDGFWDTAPTGWVLCSGRTIGDASSGATERANADTSALFALLWARSNTLFPIQNSDGTAGTRGANAAADYALHKRMPLPDLRGRTRYGVGNMGGSESNRLNGQITTGLGQAGGAQGNSGVFVQSAGNNTISFGTLTIHQTGGVVSSASASVQAGVGASVVQVNDTVAISATVDVGGVFHIDASGTSEAFSTTSPGMEVNVAIKL